MHSFYKTIFLFLLSTSLYSSTMYTLSNIKKVYPVIEIMTKDVPQEYKSTILEEVESILNELKLDYSGHDERAFAILISSVAVNTSSVITIELLIGEQVQRAQTNEKIFAATYVHKEYFILEKGDDVEDKLEDTLSSVLDKFSEQYLEENQKLNRVKIDEENFAKEMGYETSYEEAVKKAKQTKKNIMFVVVANYCPWCRKFEQRVLLKDDVNKIIQKNYIPLILNKEKDIFPKKLKKSFSPIVYFLDYKTLEPYETVIGYNKKDEFLYFLKKDK